MHDVSLSVNHDVPVVSVFNLKNVTGDRVRSHRLDKIQPGLLESDRVWRAVLGDEKRQQVVNLCSTHLIARCGIGDDINDTALYGRMSTRTYDANIKHLTPGAVAVTRYG